MGFRVNNQSFTCQNCGAENPPHPSSSRDHCRECLYGLHVDIDPGDRANLCKGILKPVGLKVKNKKKQIVYKCEKWKKNSILCLCSRW